MLVTGSQPFPFITKEGSLSSFKTISTSQFNSDFSYGDIITGSYPLETSITSDYYPSGEMTLGEKKRRLISLKNTLNYYSFMSPHFKFSSSLGNKIEQNLRMLNIPSLFYGQSIKKRTLSCKWFLTGSLIAELQDIKGNGELVQIGPSGSNGSGSIAGVVLYNEGFIILTGSWSLHDSYTENFNPYDPFTDYPPAWIHFMATGSGGAGTVPSSSFIVDFEGTEKIPTITMLAKAEKGEFNHSNNPTYIEYGQDVLSETGSYNFREKQNLNIKNIVHTIYDDEDPEFEKLTYISKVAIYDEEKNLIGIAKVANPIRKTINDNIAIKMKLDM